MLEMQPSANVAIDFQKMIYLPEASVCAESFPFPWEQRQDLTLNYNLSNICSFLCCIL